MTGLSPALLRAWERRHGLLEPQRTEGGHRLYTSDDLHVLHRVKELLAQGRSIGEVAAMGRKTLLRPAPLTPPSIGTRKAHPARPHLNAAGNQLRESLVEAAVAIDARALDRLLDEAFSVFSPEAAISQIVEPALLQIGGLWAEGRCSVAGEHLASHKIMGRLHRLLAASNNSALNGIHLGLVACLPDEQHEIGAMLVAYWLTRFGYRVSYLGGSLPLSDLERACRTLRPAAVFLSVSRESLLETHEPQLIELLGRLNGKIPFHVGGRGVARARPALEEAGAKLALEPSSFAELMRLNG